MKNIIDFEEMQVDILIEENENGEQIILFELYSTGMALGHIKYNTIGKAYPRKDRIDKDIESAEISTCVRDGHKYLTEEQLYDFMLEVKTDKCKPFRKLIVNEVLPDIRKGNYVKITEEEKLLLEIAKEKDVAKQTMLVSKYGNLQYDKGREIGYKQAFEEIKNERLTPLCEITYIVNKIKEKIKGFSSPMLHQFLIARGLGSLELVNRNYRFKPNKNFERCIIENGWASYTNQSKTAYKFYESWADFIIENLDYYSKDLLEAKDKVYETLKEKREEKKVEELPF